MSTVSFSMVITDPTRLPTVLTCLALRLPGFTLHNSRPVDGTWRVDVINAPKDKVNEALEQLNTSSASEDFATLH